MISNKPLSKRNRIKTLTVAGIYNEYLSHVDKSYVKNFEDTDVNICIHCDSKLKLYLSEGLMICPNCGDQHFVLIDSDKPSFKDPPREVCFFAYKRNNHFNEWLAQFQAKESTDIPPSVFNEILLEIKKERIQNMAHLTNQKIREYLKKLKLKKFLRILNH